MSRTPFVIFLWIVGLCVISSSIYAGENDKDLAQKHFQAGLLLLETDNYKVAAREFEASVRLHPTKNGYFNLATCYFVLHRYNDTLNIMKRLKTEFRNQFDEKWENEIAEFEKQLKAAIIPFEFKTNIPAIRIELDGKDISNTPAGTVRYIDPGRHVVKLTKKGFNSVKEVIYVEPGQGRTVFQAMMFKPTPQKTKEEEVEVLEQDTTHPVYFKKDKRDEPKRKPRVWTAVFFSIGGAAGAAAIVTGVIHLSGVSSIRDECAGSRCIEDSEREDKLDTMKRLGVATNVLISVAAVGLVVGTILAFVEGKSDEREQRIAISPSVFGSGGGLFVSGKF